MKTVFLFTRLIRWPNLLFLFLTQFLFQYGVISPLLIRDTITPVMKPLYFALVAFGVTLIAAAGYIINDYFDIAIDEVNKPGKVFITKGIGKTAALAWYGLMNLTALGAIFYVNSYMPDNSALFIAGSCIVLLFIYSAWLKKKLLIGNLLVAGVTALSILMLACIQGRLIRMQPPGAPVFQSIFWLTAGYTGFAFIISLIREAVKDLEDLEGDKKFGCTTMPLVWGINNTRLFITGWLLLLIIMLLLLQTVFYRYRLWPLSAYTILLIIIPLIVVLKKLFGAKNAVDYHQLSSYLKLIMLAGILSMLFFRYPGFAG